MLENASPPEIWYPLPSAVGLAMAALLLYLSVGDEMRRRRARVNGLVRLDVQKSIATASMLVVALGCLTQIGVNQMMTPANPNIVFDPVTASTTVQNALLFVLVDVSLIALTAYRLLQRGAVGRALVEAQRRDRRAEDRPAMPPESTPC